MTRAGEVAACTGKERFQTPQLAWGVLLRERRRSRGLEAYRCDFCGRFHIGTRLKEMDDD